MKKVGGIGLLVVLLIQKCVSGSVDGGSFLHLLPDTTDSEYSWQYSSEHDIFSSANEANVLNYQPTESPLLSFTRKSVDTESLLRPVSAGVGRIFVRWNSSGLGGLQLRYRKYGRNPSDSAIRSILVPDVAEAYPISAVKCLVKVWLSNGMGLNSNAVVLGTVDVEANSSIKDPVLLKDRLLFKIDEKWKKDGSERFAGIIHDGEGRCASLLLINCRGCSEDLSVGSLLTDTYCYRALPLTNLVLDADVEELTATVRLPEQSALRIMSYRLTLGSFSSSYIKLSAPQQFRVRLQRVETPFAKFILSWRPPGRNGLLVKGFVIAVKMGHIEEFGQCKRFWMCEISQDKVLGNQLNDFLDEQSVFSSFCSKGEESQRKIIITPEALAKSMGNLDSDQTVEFDGLTDTFYSAAIAAYTRDGILSRSTVIEFTVPLVSPYSSGHLQGFLKRVKRENSQFSSSAPQQEVNRVSDEMNRVFNNLSATTGQTEFTLKINISSLKNSGATYQTLVIQQVRAYQNPVVDLTPVEGDGKLAGKPWQANTEEEGPYEKLIWSASNNITLRSTGEGSEDEIEVVIGKKQCSGSDYCDDGALNTGTIYSLQSRIYVGPVYKTGCPIYLRTETKMGGIYALFATFGLATVATLVVLGTMFIKFLPNEKAVQRIDEIVEHTDRARMTEPAVLTSTCASDRTVSKPFPVQQTRFLGFLEECRRDNLEPLKARYEWVENRSKERLADPEFSVSIGQMTENRTLNRYVDIVPF